MTEWKGMGVFNLNRNGFIVGLGQVGTFHLLHSKLGIPKRSKLRVVHTWSFMHEHLAKNISKEQIRTGNTLQLFVLTKCISTVP